MKILVLTSPRSASTSYCKFLCKRNNLVDCGEPFKLGTGHLPDSKDHFNRANELYFSSNDALIKVHAGHIAEYVTYRPKGWFQDVVSDTTDIHFLLRADTQAQIRSLFVGIYTGNQIAQSDKSTHDFFHNEWENEIIIPDTPETRRTWELSEALVHANLMGLSVLYHNLMDHEPKIIWCEDVVDILPGGKYNRPVKFDWEPEYMFSDDDRFPADIKKIFKTDQEFL